MRPRATGARSSPRIAPSGAASGASIVVMCALVPPPTRMNANLYALLAAHFPESAEQPCLLIPGAAGRPLRRARRRVGALRACADRRRGATGRSRGRAGGQVLGGARALPRLPARRLRLSAAQHGLPEERALLPLRRCGAVGHRLRPAVRRAHRGAASRGAGADARERQGNVARSGGRPAGRRSTRSYRSPTTSRRSSTRPGRPGRPKGAMLTHRNLASNALTLVQFWGFTRGDVLLHALPIYHVHGLFVACHCALLSGARMLWLAKFDAEEVRALLPRATVMMGVPTFYTRLLALPSFGAADCRTVRLFVSGSAPLLAETFDEFRAADRAHDPRALRNDRNGDDHVESARRRADRAAPSARRFPAFRCASSMPRGSACAAGEIGGVEVKGPNVFAGYWRMPDKTREEFTADGYFRTGDMGELPAERLSAHRRPREGPHHHRRPQRLSEGNRGEDRRAPRRRRIRGHRRARCRFRRSGRGGRRRAAWPRADGDGRDRRAAGRDRAVQGSEARAVRRRSCRATRWARSRRTCLRERFAKP